MIDLTLAAAVLSMIFMISERNNRKTYGSQEKCVGSKGKALVSGEKREK